MKIVLRDCCLDGSCDLCAGGPRVRVRQTPQALPEARAQIIAQQFAILNATIEDE